jgi:hypothetical protein
MSTKHYQWMIMEELQDEHPHLHFGWDGFALAIVFYD